MNVKTASMGIPKNVTTLATWVISSLICAFFAFWAIAESPMKSIPGGIIAAIVTFIIGLVLMGLNNAD